VESCVNLFATSPGALGLYVTFCTHIVPEACICCVTHTLGRGSQLCWCSGATGKVLRIHFLPVGAGGCSRGPSTSGTEFSQASIIFKTTQIQYLTARRSEVQMGLSSSCVPVGGWQRPLLAFSGFWQPCFLTRGTGSTLNYPQHFFSSPSLPASIVTAPC
jgi:hypothetical protein